MFGSTILSSFWICFCLLPGTCTSRGARSQQVKQHWSRRLVGSTNGLALSSHMSTNLSFKIGICIVAQPMLHLESGRLLKLCRASGYFKYLNFVPLYTWRSTDVLLCISSQANPCKVLLARPTVCVCALIAHVNKPVVQNWHMHCRTAYAALRIR